MTPKLRLPDAVAPESYRVKLTLDPAKPSFAGSIMIRLNIKKPVDVIWLNANKITVSKASLRIGDKNLIAKPLPGGDDFLGFQFDSPLAPGPAELNVTYSGLIRKDSTSGIFSQTDNGNNYLYTQFESVDARAAFPCFDEPSYKVPWQLTLKVPQSDAAISNTPVTQEKAQGDGKTYVFAETKPLPSYLVAFAVGPFEFVDAGHAGSKKVPVRIVVPKGHLDEAKYAQEVTGTIIDRLEEYFGVPYPYEKADQVAVPTFPGAMENPGMVTYFQNGLLAKPARDTDTRQREYVDIAAHELAHQWFGDLVTAAWWDDIWLNEAFATWMQRKLVADWKPEWKTRAGDVNDTLRVKTADGQISARRIRQEIKSKDDIANAFDGVTYQKGAAVIGMFENWIGPEPFRRGVQTYLKRYAFRNATASDFLDSIALFGDKRLAGAFLTFLDQAGVPLVSASLDCKPNATPILQLHQERYTLLGIGKGADQKWQIPFCIRYENGAATERSCTLLTQTQSALKLKGSCPKWVEANDNAAGYYYVGYSSELLRSLAEGDIIHRVSSPERVELLGTAKGLVSTGALDAVQTLRLIEKLHDDPEREVALSSIDFLTEISWQLVPKRLEPNFGRFVSKSFGRRARELGWVPKQTEQDDSKLLRPALLQVAATVGEDQDLAQRARKLTDRWFDDRTAIDPAMLTATLRTATYYGDRALFDKLLAAYTKSNDHQERADILDAMNDWNFPSFRDRSAIQAEKEAVVSGAVPITEGTVLFLTGPKAKEARKIPFDFMKSHFKEIYAKTSEGQYGFGGFLALSPFVGLTLCDTQSEREFKNFFEPRLSQLPGAPRNFAHVVDGIENCIAIKPRNQPSLETFLERY